jgi:Ca-activated chloride channel family protein
MLHTRGPHLTVHVIGYRPRDSTEVYGILQSRCLAEETGGLYISAETTDELASAFQRTLGYPVVSRR